MRMLVFTKLLIAIASCCVCNGIKRSRIERNHAEHGHNQNKLGCGHCVDDIQNQSVKVTVCCILSNKICCTAYLKSKTIVAQHDETYDCGTYAKYIAAKYCLLDCSSS